MSSVSHGGKQRDELGIKSHTTSYLLPSSPPFMTTNNIFSLSLGEILFLLFKKMNPDWEKSVLTVALYYDVIKNSSFFCVTRINWLKW